MNKGIKVFSTGILLSAMLIGCSPSGGPGGAPASGEAASEQAVPVAVVSPVKGTVQAGAGLTGKLAPIEEVQVAPKANGKISEMSVIVGQKVKKGDVLFRLDQTDLMQTVKQNEASLQSALASLKQTQSSASQSVDSVKNKVNQAANNIEQLKSSLIQAEQALADATINRDRTKLLFEQGAASKVELENAETALLNSQTSVDSTKLKLKDAEDAYANAKSELNHANQKSSVTVAQSSVNQAQVNLQNAKEQLANATVKAPISGIVANVTGATGQMATSQSAVVTIVNTDQLLVKAYLSEKEVKTVKAGDQVDVLIPALNKTMKAEIRSVSPVMDSEAKAYPIEVTIANASNEFQADMVAEIKLPSADQGKALIIPKSAILEEEGKKYVFEVENNVAKKVEVSTGTESSDSAEIISGLTEKDQVVVRGQTLLKDGSKVQVEK